jgi:HD-GYP domain-containing protein (c-di-GMP phosphodiesterase class II)
MKGVKVAVEQLQPGIYVQLPLKWFQHPFVLNHFKIKTDDQIKIIKSLGVRHVMAVPSKSDAKPIPMSELVEDTQDEAEVEELKDELTLIKEERMQKLKSFKSDLGRTEKCFQNSMNHVRNIMRDMRNKPAQSVDQATELIDEITDHLLNKGDAVLHLMNESKEDEGLYYHALNVSVLAMLLGKKKGLGKEDLTLLGLAGLFHDVGKLKIPAQILRKTEPLNAAESNLLKLHPKYSSELLVTSSNFDDRALKLIEQHHEFYDGSGHPLGLEGKELDPLSHILSVVNNYDSLCHPINIKNAKTPFAALAHQFKVDKAKYEEDSLSLLVKLLGIYPPGTVVELDSGQCALVISVNLNKLLAPNVLIYDPLVPKDEAVILDLDENEDLKIVKAIHPSQLSEEVFSYLNPRMRVNYYFDHTDKA